MQINTELLALVIGVVALISPVVTSLINCYFQFKVKKIDKEEQVFNSKIKHIEDIFIGYLSSVGKVVATSTFGDLADYGKYYPLILLYIPVDKRDVFQNLDADILVDRNIQGVNNKYNQVVDIIDSELQKLYKANR